MSSDSATPAPPPSRTGWLQRSVREPLLQFLVFGAVIFAFSAWRAAVHDAAATTIVIDTPLVSYLQKLYSVQYGFKPDAETLDYLIHNYVREEVLRREAMKRGLERDDEIIRRRLVQKMEFLVEDGSGEPVASDTGLQQWYDQHKSSYPLPVQASFQHVYFSVDKSDDARAQARAKAVLAQLVAGKAAAAMTGDRFPLDSNYQDLDEAAVTQLFGDSEMSAAVFAATPQQWSGPYRSGLGWHLLKVAARSDKGIQPFDAVKQQVLADWQQEARKLRADAQLNALIAHYHIVRQP